MEQCTVAHLCETSPLFLSLILVAFVWDAVWKLIALWKAARNSHIVWFICLAIFNTVGILPIIYVLINRKNNKEQQTPELN